MKPRQGQDLYLIQSDRSGSVKVGRSGNAEARLLELQTGSPHRLRLIAVFDGKGHLEKSIHRRLERWRLKADGEWFHPDGLPDLPDWMYERITLDEQDWWITRRG